MMKFNREDIIKALECCGIDRCDDCPCYTEELGCDHNLPLLALELVKEFAEENEHMQQLKYGILKEFEDGTILWYEPITDTIDGFVLRKFDFDKEINEIIRIWQ